jgi:hypothetical protein
MHQLLPHIGWDVYDPLQSDEFARTGNQIACTEQSRNQTSTKSQQGEFMSKIDFQHIEAQRIRLEKMRAAYKSNAAQNVDQWQLMRMAVDIEQAITTCLVADQLHAICERIFNLELGVRESN